MELHWGYRFTLPAGSLNLGSRLQPTPSCSWQAPEALPKTAWVSLVKDRDPRLNKALPRVQLPSTPVICRTASTCTHVHMRGACFVTGETHAIHACVNTHLQMCTKLCALTDLAWFLMRMCHHMHGTLIGPTAALTKHHKAALRPHAERREPAPEEGAGVH